MPAAFSSVSKSEPFVTVPTVPCRLRAPVLARRTGSRLRAEARLSRSKSAPQRDCASDAIDPDPSGRYEGVALRTGGVPGG
ncbi:hypothetical protein BRC68_14790 [Halobacteriales archaeon QH_6_64_20]|nr:MAG: hypothetical protein BRC68_14790 [Halobacteriales archaeon QH_6_64_20]